MIMVDDHREEPETQAVVGWADLFSLPGTSPGSMRVQGGDFGTSAKRDAGQNTTLFATSGRRPRRAKSPHATVGGCPEGKVARSAGDPRPEGRALKQAS